MSAQSSVTRGTGVLLNLAALVVIIAGLRAAQGIVLPLLLAVFIAIMTMPPVIWLTRHRVPTWLAVLIVVLLTLAIVAGVGGLITASLADFRDKLPGYQERLRGVFEGSLAWLRDRGVETPGERLLELVNPGDAMQFAANMLTGLGGVLGNTVVIILVVVFLLLESTGFPRRLASAFGNSTEPVRRFDTFAESLNRYIALKTWISLGTGFTSGVVVWLIGVDFPLLWGLLAFLCNYIPNIGSFLAAIPPVLLALLQFGWGWAIVVAAAFVAINFLFGNVIEPRAMGRGLGLSPAVVIIALIAWGWIFGPVGMFLSVPLTIALKMALESGENTRWLAALLGEGKR